AKAQLSHLEGSASPATPGSQDKTRPAPAPAAPTASEPVYQGDMFASLEPSAVEEALKALDVDDLTPREAMNRLYELKELLKK
ncbi:MAG: hypothetical protein VX324_02575, partial [Pseudomonadota bacterium]|nr:hypothetical protein [Pseudomonadota bacterium]